MYSVDNLKNLTIIFIYFIAVIVRLGLECFQMTNYCDVLLDLSSLPFAEYATLPQ